MGRGLTFAEFMRRRCLISLVGDAAESLLAGSSRHCADTGDQDRIARLITEYAPLAGEMQHLQHLAERLVRQHAETIHAVARALLDRGSLDEREIADLVSR